MKCESLDLREWTTFTCYGICWDSSEGQQQQQQQEEEEEEEEETKKQEVGADFGCLLCIPDYSTD
jgi:hypothetical protein